MAEAVSQETCDSLSKKLAALDLSDDEARVLEAVIGAAGSMGPEVEGFAAQGLFPSRSLTFLSVKVDVHPLLITDRDTGRPSAVVINHEEQ